MKTVIFKSNEYELKETPNVTSSRFQCALEKKYSIDALVEDVTGANIITIKEDGIVTAVYNGYTTMLAVAVYGDSISVELINEDIQMQIDALDGKVSTQGDAIENIQDNIAAITPYTTTKTAYIDDTEVVFENVPSGNLTVYFDGDYESVREDNRVIVTFEPLKEPKEVTISII